MIIMKIYEIRTALYMTEKMLAEKSGIAQSTINAVENGKQSPTLYTLDKIAKALGCSVKDLFDEA